MRSDAERRGYLDWLRGVGVLIMIEAHTLDAWTRLDERDRLAYQWAILVGGFGAPIFLFLAGMAMTLAANRRTRRGLSDRDAGRAAMRRALQVLGLAFLFRLQSLIISGGGLRAFLKVDILNVMGVSMVMAAALWKVAPSPKARAVLFTAATLGAAMLTPPVRATGALDWLPAPLEAYLRPEAGRSTFTVFPWSGFLFAGVVAGMWLDSGPIATDRRRIAWLAAIGIAVGLTGYASSFLPAIYAQTSFWTSSPTFFFLRLGLVAALVGIAFAWVRFTPRWSPLQEFGVASLFVYWIHVEMVYGVLSTPLHRALSFEQALGAMLAFSVLLWGLVRMKGWVGRRDGGGEKAADFGSFRAS